MVVAFAVATAIAAVAVILFGLPQSSPGFVFVVVLLLVALAAAGRAVPFALGGSFG